MRIWTPRCSLSLKALLVGARRYPCSDQTQKSIDPQMPMGQESGKDKGNGGISGKGLAQEHT